MNINLPRSLIAVCMIATVSAGFSVPNGEAKQFKFSTTIEKERPELNEETKRLISAYRRDPSKANFAALRKQVETNYDKVIGRKKAKLEELKRTARDAFKVREMQEIVDDVVQNRENRIEQSMRRFTDPRLGPGSRHTNDGYLPVLGAGQNVMIAYTPITNEEYSQFIKATGRKPPENWMNGIMPADKGRHPVVNVSHDDAVAYCHWLSNRDGKARYRLPTETEWEFAAGHMPKDADFNCGGKNGTSPVDAYTRTLAACGAIDMWGNCWEWTSTKIATSQGMKGGKAVMAVKGGSWRSPRMSCRTERKGEGRESSADFGDVGFRVVREK